MSGLRHHDLLPLRWSEPDARLAPHWRERYGRDNERLLTLLPALDGLSAELVDDDAPESRHLKGIDLKLQLLMEMVGELLARDGSLPEPHELWLGADGIAWLDEQAPAPDAELLVELYPQPLLPKPLRLPVRVLSVTAGNSRQRVEAAYLGLSDTASDLLEKLVFRYHRRAVATQRRG